MVERILLATDFTSLSEQALRRAARIAKATGASLTLAHTVSDNQPERLRAPALMDAKARLGAIANDVKQHGINAAVLVNSGSADIGVMGAADESNADLIVVGPHRHATLGTPTGRTIKALVSATQRPLLIAVAAPVMSYRRSLLAIAFDEVSAAAARAALALGVFDHTQVTVTHAASTQEQEPALMTRLQAFMIETGLPLSKARALIVVGSPAAAILKAAQQEENDLIILGTSQRRGLKRLLIGSVATDVGRHSRCDLLIVPAS